ncbi:MAG: DPP IV N-terminal domain-containing protein [Candidatus Zixiibacteriota bacterium]
MTVRFFTRTVVALGILLPGVLGGADAFAQFGKNKIQYREFDWQYISSEHFDIYFYDGGYDLAVFSATVLESAYVEVSAQLSHSLHKRVPVIIYQSHNEFQQTNVTSSLLEEGVGGFTESFKNRMVMPFTGSYEDFRHVLHHELTHAVMFDMLFGGVGSILSRQALFNVPLWYAEGFAEYSSRHGWDTFADMVIRDATVHNYLVPLDYVGGYLAYKEGQSAVLYLAERYGEEKIAEVLSKGRFELTMDNALKKAIGMGTKEFSEEWQKRLRREYWPEISIREEPKTFARQLTDHEKDGSYFNEKPVFSPRGDRIAILTETADNTEVRIISTVDGKHLRTVIKGGRTDRFESLHSFVSGMDFSPDGSSLALIAKSSGHDALMLLDADGNGRDRTLRFGFQSMRSPAFSPDGKSIVVTANRHDQNDLYLIDLETESVTRLTNDRYDEQDVHFHPDGDRIIFASDRPAETTTPLLLPEEQNPATFEYGRYNIFEANLVTRTVYPLTNDDAEDKTPVYAPDGSRICYVSNKNGIYNLYLIDSVGAAPFPITDALSGCFSPAWSPDGQQIAFSAFFRGGFDVFLMTNIRPKAEPGENLEPTAFVRRLSGDSSAFVIRKEVDLEERAPKLLSEDLEFTSYVQPASNPIEHMPLKQDSLDTTADTMSSAPLGPPTPHDLEGILADSDTAAAPDVAQADTVITHYEVHKYTPKFSPDLVTGGLGYDTFFGLRGQSFFVISDYMGDHQVFIATDLINTIDQSNIQVYYQYTPKRIDYGVGLFHSKYYYLNFNNKLFSDRTYGFQANVSRPFSKFTRLQLDGMMVFIDRRYVDIPEPPERDRSDRVAVGVLSLVHDAATWGLTAPANGRRYRISLEGAPDGFSDGISYRAFTFDFRQYARLGGRYSVALRLAGGISGGSNPKRFYLGGMSNWIGSTISRSSVYDVEGLYFSQQITPFRGYNYYEVDGSRFGLFNAEFRFPFIDYFAMRFPLPLVLSQIGGVLFTDVGSAWYDSDSFRGTSTQGGFHLEDIRMAFGYGLRANLGFVVLRFDQAWRTDLTEVAAHPKYYFSLGADF